LRILIAALGGEGGGVLAEWIAEAAGRAGLPAQATSVPGVAQRTGATSYYLEIMRAPDPQGRTPVFALVPTAGRVDVAIASELLEAGRLIERGFVSPDRTLLIASASRVYTTAEKMHMADGRLDPDRVHQTAQALSRRYLSVDLEAIAAANGTVISAAMFGALAGAGAFPWSREICEETIRSGGRGAAASLKGFAAAFEAIGAPAAQTAGLATPAALAEGPQSPPETLPAASAGDGAPFADLPESVRNVIELGRARAIDHQDEAYGELFLERMRALAAAAPALEDPRALHALEEGARRLALWMAYEDVPRVADLKTRRTRFERIRREAEMKPDQILKVVEYLKPGAEEIAAMLPARLGEKLMNRVRAGKSLPFLGKGVNLSTTGVLGYWTMRGLAGMARFRRSSLRFREEQAAIDVWLAAMADALRRAPDFAGALAELPRILKGYGDTHLRGRANYDAIFAGLVRPALASARPGEATPALRKAIAAALADPEGRNLAVALADQLPAAEAGPARAAE
jgi:indolepyruvate ferredoxin oxidoreductase beta subunit